MEKMPSAEVPLAVAHVSSLREIYLRRLERLLRLRHEHEHDLNGRGVWLLDRSIFAAYCDCRNAGVEWEARQILREAHFLIDQPAEASQGYGMDARPNGALQEAQPEG